MAGQAQVGGRGSYKGHSGWNPRRDLAFAGRTGTTVESGVREGGMVQIPTAPNKTDREIGAVESEVREGYQVTKPTPPPNRTDRDSGEAVSRVGVTQGKRTNREELGWTDSR